MTPTLPSLLAAFLAAQEHQRTRAARAPGDAGTVGVELYRETLAQLTRALVSIPGDATALVEALAAAWLEATGAPLAADDLDAWREMAGEMVRVRDALCALPGGIDGVGVDHGR